MSKPKATIIINATVTNITTRESIVEAIRNGSCDEIQDMIRTAFEQAMENLCVGDVQFSDIQVFLNDSESEEDDEK